MLMHHERIESEKAKERAWRKYVHVWQRGALNTSQLSGNGVTDWHLSKRIHDRPENGGKKDSMCSHRVVDGMH